SDFTSWKDRYRSEFFECFYRQKWRDIYPPSVQLYFEWDYTTKSITIDREVTRTGEGTTIYGEGFTQCGRSVRYCNEARHYTDYTSSQSDDRERKTRCDYETDYWAISSRYQSSSK